MMQHSYIITRQKRTQHRKKQKIHFRFHLCSSQTNAVFIQYINFTITTVWNTMYGRMSWKSVLKLPWRIKVIVLSVTEILLFYKVIILKDHRDGRECKTSSKKTCRPHTHVFANFSLGFRHQKNHAAKH